jgi:hypothetical protein
MNVIDWISENSSLVLVLTAIFAIITSITSIILTIWALCNQRIHNINSVKPIAFIELYDYDDKISVELTNRGVGTLLVKRFKAYKDGNTKSNIIKWMPILPPGQIWTTFYDEIEGIAIEAGKSIILVEYSPSDRKELDIETIKILRLSLKDIIINVTYTDIYEKSEMEYRKELKWFGRHFKN